VEIETSKTEKTERSPESKGWLQGLEPQTVEAVFQFMRAMRGRSDALLEQSKKLTPKYGFVGGSAHVEPFARGEALATYLSRLGKGDKPEEALKAAKEESLLCSRKWNEKCQKDPMMQRWEEADFAYLDGVHRAMLQVLELARPCESCG
jgi:hypothetical protein